MPKSKKGILFHPVIQNWFSSQFKQPGPPQKAGWAEIAAGRITLILSPPVRVKPCNHFILELINDCEYIAIMKPNDFKDVLKALHKFEVEYVLIGGVAVNFHGISRLTEDIDLFIKNTQENIDKIRNALNSLYDDESLEEITFAEVEKHAVVRYGTPHEFYIDLIGRLGEAFSYEDIKYEIFDMGGTPVRLAKIDTLIELKKNTYREKDQADIIMLSKIEKDGR